MHSHHYHGHQHNIYDSAIVREFIFHQVHLLRIERYHYQRQIEEEKRLCETLYGTIVKKKEPCYGGTIATLELKTTLKKGRSSKEVVIPLKQGSPVGLGAVNSDACHSGIVVLIK